MNLRAIIKKWAIASSVGPNKRPYACKPTSKIPTTTTISYNSRLTAYQKKKLHFEIVFF